MSQARLLFTAAHGSAPPATRPLKKPAPSWIEWTRASWRSSRPPCSRVDALRAETAPSRVFAFASLRGGDGDPVAVAARAAGMKSRHEMHVRELNARRVGRRIRRAGAPKRRPVARPRHASSGGHRPRARRGAGVVLAHRSRGRTVRYLEAIARGVWVLHGDYPRGRRGGGRWLPRRISNSETRVAAATDTGGRARPRPRFGRGRGRDENQTTVSARVAISPRRRVLPVGPAGRPPSRREGAPDLRGETVQRPVGVRGTSRRRGRVCSRRRGRECEGGVWRRDARLARRRVDVGPRPSRTSPAVPDSQRTDEADPDPGVVDSEDDGGLEAVADGGGIGKGRARPRDERERAGRTGRGHRAAHGGDHGEGVERTAVRAPGDGTPRVGLALGVSLGDSHRRCRRAYFLDGSRGTPASPES